MHQGVYKLMYPHQKSPGNVSICAVPHVSFMGSVYINTSPHSLEVEAPLDDKSENATKNTP